MLIKIHQFDIFIHSSQQVPGGIFVLSGKSLYVKNKPAKSPNTLGKECQFFYIHTEWQLQKRVFNACEKGRLTAHTTMVN
jgi:hypothetical protein